MNNDRIFMPFRLPSLVDAHTPSRVDGAFAHGTPSPYVAENGSVAWDPTFAATGAGKRATVAGAQGRHKVAVGAWAAFFGLVYIVIIMKVLSWRSFFEDPFFAFYSTAVAFFILSRFALAYFYTPSPKEQGANAEPTVTFAVPSKNEGEHIRETILRMAVSDYPKEKFDIIAVNDGSTDDTLAEMEEAAKIGRAMGVTVTVVDWKQNRGKRAGMAECVRRSQNEVVLFVDSDSFIEPDTVRRLVRYFGDPKIGAIAGHAYVANAETNYLTKMQAVRYYVAFKAYKAAEALFGAVTCCSGCLAAYRRDALLPFIDAWENQRFLGAQCTYGDDRALTNFVLRAGYDAIFENDATARTFVPDNFRQFMRQQLRWKKSWLRESLLAGSYIWKRNVIMSVSFYLGFLLPLLAPVIVIRALVWYPLAMERFPWFYVSGITLMAVIYGLYYYGHTRDGKWIYGVAFSVFYTLVLIWQLPYAIFSIRDGKWGTR